jgi:DNA replication and repair protein RecF
VLVGANGAGKTNVLEAIGYLSTGKSFLASSDQHVVQRGLGHFDVEGEVEGEHRPDARLRVAVVPGEGKRAFVNGSPLDRLADLVGRLPAVILSPADHDLTAGGPAERRRFLDTTLCQSSSIYLADLMAYRRALQQKNVLLLHLRRGKSFAPGTLDAWDEELAQRGGPLIARRAAFLDRFASFVAQAFLMLDSPGEAPSLVYSPSVQALDAASPVDSFRAALAQTSRRSREMGRTLAGPHLDEVVFQLGGYDLRPYASQGQHRTFGLALRIAQALYLQDDLDEPPLLLLDDVFGPLDPGRSRLVLDLLGTRALGQSLITAARSEPFERLFASQSSSHALFHVERGVVHADHPLPTPTTSS